jgi:hypothetical protein
MELKFVLKIIVAVIIAWRTWVTWDKRQELKPGMTPTELDKLRHEIFADGMWILVVFTIFSVISLSGD